MPVAMDLNLSSPRALQAACEDGEGEDLRPLDWAALIARLGAERDLRRELARVLAAPQRVADFMGGAAQVVGGPSHNAPHDAPGVNPDALANRKSTGGNMFAGGAMVPAAKLGARGQQ